MLDRNENVEMAKGAFIFFSEVAKESIYTLTRTERTRYVIGLMAFFRLINDEHVFFNPKYLQPIIDYWKIWRTRNEEPDYQARIGRYIREYEERLKAYKQKEIGEIGERFVDLCSSDENVPIHLEFAMEYEAGPTYGDIMYDFRKLLDILAPIKVGIFHLPRLYNTSKMWLPNEETGQIQHQNEVLDSNKPEELIEHMEKEIKGNELEHPSSVYLVILIRQPSDETQILGYLMWRELTGEVHSEQLIL